MNLLFPFLAFVDLMVTDQEIGCSPVPNKFSVQCPPRHELATSPRQDERLVSPAVFTSPLSLSLLL